MTVLSNFIAVHGQPPASSLSTSLVEVGPGLDVLSVVVKDLVISGLWTLDTGHW